MRMIDVRSGLEVIDRDRCLELLASRGIGRVGVVVGGRPVILPVNYGLDGERVVFRTAPGTKLDAAVRRTNVAFEIDEADASSHGGWSVVVSGWADEVTGPDLDRARALGIEPWAEGERSHFIAIQPDRITGRRVTGSAPTRPDAGPAV